MVLRPTEKLPCQLAEGIQDCTALFGDIGYHRGVVTHCRYFLVGDYFPEGLKGQEQSFISKMLMWREVSWFDHSPDAD